MKPTRLRRRLATATAALTLLALGACSSGPTGATDGSGTASGTSASVTAATFTTPAETHADSDDGDYDTAGATTITLADGSSKVAGSGATVKGEVVTITTAGTYLLSGTLSDGQVVVDSPGDGKVELVLDGVDITSAKTSPVVVSAADEAVVILASGTTNTLSDSAASAADDDQDDAPTATLFSMADLTIAGDGTLDVTGASNDGITSKDGLVVLSGTIDVDAVDDGLRGKDYLAIEKGTVQVKAGGDALKSDNEKEPGWIQLDGGSVTVQAGSDGADAVGAVNVAAGTLTVTKAYEGLEAEKITIAGGTVDVTTSDDGLNATDGSVAGGGEAAEDGVLVTISGGTVLVNAGADGIDSNGSATITGGTTAISAATGAGGGNGPFDVNGTLSAPAVATVTGQFTAGQRISLTDADGKVVATFVLGQDSSSLVVASPGLTPGDSYTVYSGAADGSSASSVNGLSKVGTVTAAAAATAGGGGGGGRGGFGHGPNGFAGSGTTGTSS